MEDFLELLGKRVTDKVTGFKGVVTTVAFDLYGCIQAIVQPSVSKEGNPVESAWFDVDRLIVHKKRVMVVPSFEKAMEGVYGKGPGNKPTKQEKPLL